MSSKRTPLELFLFWHELMSMPDYSATLPSGTTIGKFWRRREPYRSENDAPDARHFVGTYIPGPDAEHVSIVWFDVVLRAGPAPRRYEPPDWHYYEGWKAQMNRAAGAPR